MTGSPASSGVAANEPGPLAADAIALDPFQQTNVPGVFAAGDLSGQMPSVANAVAAGSNAASMILRDLLGEEFGTPI